MGLLSELFGGSPVSDAETAGGAAMTLTCDSCGCDVDENDMEEGQCEKSATPITRAPSTAVERFTRMTKPPAGVAASRCSRVNALMLPPRRHPRLGSLSCRATCQRNQRRIGAGPQRLRPVRLLGRVTCSSFLSVFWLCPRQRDL